jgi:hypothetical protein
MRRPCTSTRRYRSTPSPPPAQRGSRDRCGRTGPDPQECGREARRRAASRGPSAVTSVTPSRRRVSARSPRHTVPGKMPGGVQRRWSWPVTGCRARSYTSRKALASTRIVLPPRAASPPRPPRPSRPARTARDGAPACSRPARRTPTRDLRASTRRRARLDGDCRSPPLPTHIIMPGGVRMVRHR